MNNKGQVFFYLFMIGLTLIILAMALAPALREQTDSARNPSNMDCANASISTVDKVTCVVADLNLFYFIGGVIFIAGSIITAKILTG